MRKPWLIPALLAVLAATPVLADDATPDNQKKPEHKVTQSASYLDMDPFYTTIVNDNRSAGMLMVAIGLDVPDSDLRGEVSRSLPVLRDAYLRNLMAFTAGAVRTDEQPDVATIANRLQGVTDRALKKKGARVLISQVALRVTR
jgi:flagellar basal body-associated protein FliL